MARKKSLFITYVLWLFGGIFGVHHFYLNRDRQAFVWWSTLGGFLIGWLGEVARIPRYVAEANMEPEYVQGLVKRMQQYKRVPPFSMNRFTGMLLVGYSWGQMMMYAVPPDTVFGISCGYFNALIPLATSLGVWTVGNIGKERGLFIWAMLGAYVVYPLRYFIIDDTIWFTLMVLSSALVFDHYKEWRRTPEKPRHIVKRLAILSVCAALYLSMWTSYVYYQGTITDSEGDEVPIYEAIHHFFTSPWWLDVKQCLLDTYQFAQHHGWYEVWKQIIDLSDPHGEQNAYKVLGVGRDSSQQEITSRWRQLSREHHPDKARPEQREVAQERFMEIQRAYEILSNNKHRRSRRNKKDNSDNSN